jgi:hypothetical protein
MFFGTISLMETEYVETFPTKQKEQFHLEVKVDASP